MTIAEDRLLAYVDGHLSAEDAAEIETLLVADAEAAALVAALRASALPYREAAETLISVPDLSALEARITAGPARSAPVSRRWLSAAAAIAVVFAAGLLAGQHVFPPNQPEKTQWAKWLEEIAIYQALYTRETLSLPNPPPDRLKRQMDRVSRALGQPIAAPDYRDVKAHFKYARMYGIDGQPLAQIAYLPEKGRPFSLCMMKTDVPDHPPRYASMRGMQLATWRHKGIAWVFVGDVSKTDLDRYVEIARAQHGS